MSNMQFENRVGNTLQDAKLARERKSFYNVYDMWPFAKVAVLRQAQRQWEAARNIGCKVEWVISTPEARKQWEALFAEEGIDISVTYRPKEKGRP